MSEDTNKITDEHITIKIEAPTGQAIKVTTKPSAKVRKLLATYCKHKNVNPEDYRLVYKNQFLADNTPISEYGIQGGDVLSVMTQQTGGIN